MDGTCVINWGPINARISLGMWRIDGIIKHWLEHQDEMKLINAIIRGGKLMNLDCLDSR